MDIIKCEAFLRAVDTGSLSSAALELGYSASGVIRMVNALEAEVGFPMLARNKKGVVLTADGKRLLPAIREIVHWNEQVLQRSAEIRGLSIGNLTIGTYYSIASRWLPETISVFQTDYPGIRINTLEGGYSNFVSWLDERRVDLCFFSERSTNADWIPLKRDELVVWLPKTHPKAKLTAFPLQEVSNEPFVKTLTDYDSEKLLEDENLTPDVRFTTLDNYATYSMVSAGLGISLSNKLMAQNWSEDVTVLPLDPQRYITLGIAIPSLKDASPAAKKFISCAKRMIRDK